MSSAKSIVVLYRIEFCKSFIYIRNSKGPRHEPVVCHIVTYGMLSTPIVQLCLRYI